MFPLFTKTFPATAADLASLLNGSLTQFFSAVAAPVSLQEKNYPKLAELRISLDGAKLRPNPPKPPVVKGASSPAVYAEQLVLNAAGISVGPGIADLQLSARDVRLDQARAKDDGIVLVLRSASEGQVEVSVEMQELEQAIATIAKAEAGKQGVSIERVQLTARERGPRGISAEVQLHARKLFFSTVIRIAGNLDLDEKLNATIAGVECKGDGAIGALACGVLNPHLQKIKGRVFPLMALPLGEIRLRGVRLSVAEKIVITAEFGA